MKKNNYKKKIPVEIVLNLKAMSKSFLGIARQSMDWRITTIPMNEWNAKLMLPFTSMRTCWLAYLVTYGWTDTWGKLVRQGGGVRWGVVGVRLGAVGRGGLCIFIWSCIDSPRWMPCLKSQTVITFGSYFTRLPEWRHLTSTHVPSLVKIFYFLRFEFYY